MKESIIILLMGTILALAPTSACGGNEGTKGASFLKIGQGARSIGMGYAHTAVVDDVYAIWWNPAALSKLKYAEASYMHLFYFESINYDYLGYAQPIGGEGAIGGSLVYLNYGTIDGWKEDGITSNKYTAYDSALTLTYARGIESLSFGGGLKLIKSRIEDEESTALGVDMGGLYSRDRLSLGLTIQNISLVGVKFVKEEDPLPLVYRLGMAYRLLDPLTFGMDLGLPTDNDPYIAIGGEYWYREMIACRAGYRSGPKALDLGGGICCGVGFRLKSYKVDFAWEPWGELKDTYYISLSCKF